MHLLKKVFVFSLCAALLFGCSTSPEDAKENLKEHGYSFSDSGVAKAVQEKDYDALEWFKIAGISKDMLMQGLSSAMDEKVLDAKAVGILLSSSEAENWKKSSMANDAKNPAYENASYERYSLSALIFRKLHNLTWQATELHQASKQDEYQKAMAILDEFSNHEITPHFEILAAASRDPEVFKKVFEWIDGFIGNDVVWKMAVRGGNQDVLSFVAGKAGPIPSSIANDVFQSASTASSLAFLRDSGFVPDQASMQRALQRAKDRSDLDSLVQLLEFKSSISKDFLDALLSSFSRAYYSNKPSAEVASNFVKLAVSQGANINGSSTNDIPLLNAVSAGNDTIVSALLQNGANPNVSDRYRSALKNAFTFTDSESEKVKVRVNIINALIDAGAKPDSDALAEDCLFTAIALPLSDNSRGNDEGEQSKMIQTSLELTKKLTSTWNLDLNRHGVYDLSPLMVTAIAGNSAVAEWLMSQGVDVSSIKHNDGDRSCEITVTGNKLYQVSKNGSHDALQFAITTRHPEVANLILGKDLDVKLIQNQSSFLWAVMYGDKAIVDAFLEKGMPADTRDGNGYTALMVALAHAELDIASSLVDKGANVNAIKGDRVAGMPAFDVGNEGWSGEFAWSPVTMTLANMKSDEKKDVLRKALALLLDKGADVSIEPPANLFRNYRDNFSVMNLAWENASDLIPELLKRGANPNAKDDRGQHELVWDAAYFGKTEILDELLAYGANPNSAVSGAWGGKITALEMATENGHVEAVKVLLDYGATVTERAKTIAQQKGYSDVLQMFSQAPAAPKKPGWKKPSA